MKIVFFLMAGITSLFFKCAQKDKLGFSYNVNLYLKDSAGNSKNSTSYFTYGDDLLEILVAENNITKLNGRTGVRVDTVVYDTIGYRLILAKEKMFIEIDYFSKNFKIKKKGSVDEMSGGLKLGNNAQNGWYPLKNRLLDTVIGSKKCKFVDTSFTETAENMNVEMNMKFFFFENPDFNTLFNIQGMRCLDGRYLFFGFWAMAKKEATSQEMKVVVEDIKKLSKAQKQLMASIITKCRAVINY